MCSNSLSQQFSLLSLSCDNDNNMIKPDACNCPGVVEMSPIAWDKAPCRSAGLNKSRGRFAPFQSAPRAQHWKPAVANGTRCSAGMPAKENHQIVQVNRPSTWMQAHNITAAISQLIFASRVAGWAHEGCCTREHQPQLSACRGDCEGVYGRAAGIGYSAGSSATGHCTTCRRNASAGPRSCSPEFTKCPHCPQVPHIFQHK